MTDRSEFNSACCLHYNMENSALSTLPPELRNNIYELVVVGDHPVKIMWPTNTTHRFLYRKAPKFLTSTRSSLLQTCRQSRNEASPIYYSFNTFAFDENENEVRSENLLVAWLTVLDSKQWQSLRKIRLEDGGYGPEEVDGVVRDSRQYLKRYVERSKASFKDSLQHCDITLPKAQIFVKVREVREGNHHWHVTTWASTSMEAVKLPEIVNIRAPRPS